MTGLSNDIQRSIGAAYLIDREVGRGGMATVYRARDVKHERQVAVKILDPELGAVLGAERFLSEIRVTANLQHPNLLPLFDSGEANGMLYYVMPFIEGETLRHRLLREKQLPVQEAIRIAIAIANALDYAHSHGVIHRDLKPENILLQHGQPVVADFGIALAVSNAGGSRVTQTGLSLGTPQYMSPEQAAGDRAIDARTDVYSLAAMTYEMIAGEPPHSGTSAQAIIAKLMTAEPQPLRALRPSVPQNVAMAVEVGLAKLPADRFESARAFAEALANPSFATTNALPVDASVPPGRSRREIALGAVAAGLLITTAWGWLRPTPALEVSRYALQLDSVESLATTPRWGRIALSPDGSTLVYVGGPNNALMVRPRTELHARTLAGTENAGAPEISPDGKRIAFIQRGTDLMIVSTTGGPPVRVTDSIVGLAGLAWGPDDMIYADGVGAAALVRVAARTGARPERFTKLDRALGETDQIYPEMLPDGKHLLYTTRIRTTRLDTRLSLAVMELSTGARHVLIDDAVRGRYVDPGRILYVTSEGNLMLAAFDAGSQTVTGTPTVVASDVPPAVSLADFAVSRSGRLAYVAGPGNTGEREAVWVMRNGKAEQVDSTWRGQFADVALSRDGTRLAMSTSALGTSGSDIWIKSLKGGPATKITLDGGSNRYPVWSPDGQSILYRVADSTGYAVVERRLDGSPPHTVLSSKEGIASPVLSPDGRWLIYQRGASFDARIARVRIGDSVPEQLAPGSGRQVLPALSRDGRWLAYVAVEQGGLHVYVMPIPNPTSARWLVPSANGATSPMWSNRGTELFYREAPSGPLVSIPVTVAGATLRFGTPEPLFGTRDYTFPLRLSLDDSRFLAIRVRGATSQQHLTIVENWTGELTGKRVPK